MVEGFGLEVREGFLAEDFGRVVGFKLALFGRGVFLEFRAGATVWADALDR